MLSRRAKELFYRMAGPAMWVNGRLYRVARAPRSGVVRAHLGPGQHNYLPGWINVDANMFTGKCDVWANLADGLPFHGETLDAVYSHHVVEHLPSLHAHFGEMFRCMKPGAVFRVGGPNGDAAIRKYLEGDLAWFPDWPDQRASIGGKLENFIFCRGEHLTVLTYSYLVEVASQAGFVDLRQRLPVSDTGYPEVFDAAVLALERERFPDAPRTLIVEGRKPA